VGLCISALNNKAFVDLSLFESGENLREYKMRNNQKLKLLLLNNEISISMPFSEIEMLVVNRSQNFSFVVSGKNWSDLLNKALKHANAFRNQDLKEDKKR